MIIFLPVDCKSDEDKGKPKFFKLPRDDNLKQQWLLKIKSRNI